VLGHGEAALAALGEAPDVPRSAVDHSRKRPPARACDEDPLSDLTTPIDLVLHRG
jgi:hypothetical protein